MIASAPGRVARPFSFSLYESASFTVKSMLKPKEPEFPRLFPKEYWDRPPLPNQGDSKVELTYLAVGMALSRWEILEDQFPRLFAMFLQGQYMAATRVYGSIQTSHGRREALRNAADVIFRTIAGRLKARER